MKLHICLKCHLEFEYICLTPPSSKQNYFTQSHFLFILFLDQSHIKRCQLQLFVLALAAAAAATSEAEAEPIYGYGYGHGIGFGYGRSYGGYGLSYGHGYGGYVRSYYGKREAEPTAVAEAEADPYYRSYGYGGHGLSYRSYTRS